MKRKIFLAVSVLANIFLLLLSGFIIICDYGGDISEKEALNEFNAFQEFDYKYINTISELSKTTIGLYDIQKDINLALIHGQQGKVSDLGTQLAEKGKEFDRLASETAKLKQERADLVSNAKYIKVIHP